MQLAIKLHPDGIMMPLPLCGICGIEMVPSSGPHLCLLYTDDLVCHECGNQYAPLLVNVLRFAHVAYDYSFELTEYQNECDRMRAPGLAWKEDKT